MAKKRHATGKASPGKATGLSKISNKGNTSGDVTKSLHVRERFLAPTGSTGAATKGKSRSSTPVHSDTDFDRLDRMTEADIARQIAEDEDVAPEFTDEMIAQARWVTPAKKVPISFRVDPDVLEFFKRDGEGYQSRMNAVLRAFMNAEREGKHG